MTIDVTLETIGIAVGILVPVGGIVYGAGYFWAKAKFVTRKEWHAQNNELGTILGKIQERDARSEEQFASGERRMTEIQLDARDTKILVQTAITTTSRVEGMVQTLLAKGGS